MAADELIRVYTPEGKPTDEFKTRGVIHQDGDWHATVHLWIMNSQDQLLFQKRSASAEIYPGLWDLSAAGHVVGTDSLEVSLEREAEEELGLSISAADAEYLFKITTRLITERLNEAVFQYVYLLKTDVDIEHLMLQKEEVTAVKWHSVSVLDALISGDVNFVPRVEEYTKLRNYLMQ